MGWLADKIYGKLPTNPIYGAMPDRDRRKPEKRAAYERERAKYFKDEVARLNSKLIVANPEDKDNLKAQLYASHLQLLLYGATHRSDGGYRADLEQSSLIELINLLPEETSYDSPAWVSAVEVLKRDPVFSVFFPDLTTDKLKLRAKQHHDAARARRQAAEEKAKAEKERQRQIELDKQKRREIISQMEDEMRQLRQMINNTSDFMTRAQIVSAHDAREQAISRLKSEL